MYQFPQIAITERPSMYGLPQNIEKTPEEIEPACTCEFNARCCHLHLTTFPEIKVHMGSYKHDIVVNKLSQLTNAIKRTIIQYGGYNEWGNSTRMLVYPERVTWVVMADLELAVEHMVEMCEQPPDDVICAILHSTEKNYINSLKLFASILGWEIPLLGDVTDFIDDETRAGWFVFMYLRDGCQVPTKSQHQIIRQHKIWAYRLAVVEIMVSGMMSKESRRLRTVKGSAIDHTYSRDENRMRWIDGNMMVAPTLSRSSSYYSQDNPRGPRHSDWSNLDARCSNTFEIQTQNDREESIQNSKPYYSIYEGTLLGVYLDALDRNLHTGMGERHAMACARSRMSKTRQHMSRHGDLVSSPHNVYLEHPNPPYQTNRSNK